MEDTKIHEGARKRRKQGVANVLPIVRPDEIDVDEVEDQDAAPIPFRCVFPDCPSGFRPSHLREAFFCGASEVESSMLNTLTDFVNLCASGTLPVEITQVVLAATLIPFRKNSARDVSIVGVRTIASGETLRRLVAKCVLKKVQDKFKAIVTALQCGVAVPDAINSISFTMLRYYEMLVKEPQLGLMQLDLSNAFNSVDRSAILRFVCEKLPEASAWVEWVLCAAAPLYIGRQQFLCITGVQQGDLMGPLLFASGIHNAISKRWQ